MSWQKHVGTQTWTTQKLLSTQLDRWQDGERAQLENWLLKPNPWPGIVQGLTPSISGTSVLVASGIGFVNGKVTLGSRTAPTSPAEYPAAMTMSFDFTGEAADTYWVYIDSTETTESDAVKITADWDTNGDDRDYLLLCKVTWNGTTTLSALKDLRQWGRDLAPLMHFEPDTLAVDQTIARFVIDEKCAIRCPDISISTAGTAAGPTSINVLTGMPGATVEIWADTTERFSIAHTITDGWVTTGVYPDQNLTLTKGNVVEVILVGTPATGARGCAINIPRYYYDEVA